MNIKFIILPFLLSSALIAHNYQNQLVIPSVNLENPGWQFAGQPIAQSQDGIFADLVEKWNGIIDDLCLDLNNQIYETIGASIPQLDYYMDDHRFVEFYMNYCKKIFAEIIEDDEDLDAVTANFIRLKLYFLKCPKDIKVYTKANIPVLTASFGADKEQHAIIINKDIYNQDTLNALYDNIANNKAQFHIMPHTNVHQSRAIEYTNYLHLGISQALSNVIHQSDYFSKLLLFFLYNNKSLPSHVQQQGAEFVLFRSYLECCLLSNNPLEIALFFEPYLDHFNQKLIVLWEEFVEDIKYCYDADDLQAYEKLSLEKRRESLYTSYDDEE